MESSKSPGEYALHVSFAMPMGPTVIDCTHDLPAHVMPLGSALSAAHAPFHDAGGFVGGAMDPSAWSQSAACAVIVVGSEQSPVDGAHAHAAHTAGGTSMSAKRVVVLRFAESGHATGCDPIANKKGWEKPGGGSGAHSPSHAGVHALLLADSPVPPVPPPPLPASVPASGTMTSILPSPQPGFAATVITIATAIAVELSAEFLFTVTMVVPHSKTFAAIPMPPAILR